MLYIQEPYSESFLIYLPTVIYLTGKVFLFPTDRIFYYVFKYSRQFVAINNYRSVKKKKVPNNINVYLF